MSTMLNERIRRFYNQSTNLWLDAWGEHMHHGYYGPDGKIKKERRAAQVDMMDKLLDWGGITSVEQALDLGCGVGGSARYLSRRYGARVLGLTLSEVQAEAAAEYNQEAGLDSRVKVRVQDMMTYQPQADHDLVWSLESAEHIADKAALFDLIYRSLRPGGRLLMATWCIRADYEQLPAEQQRLLDRIGRWYHLPTMAPVSRLAEHARAAGLREVQTDDWASAVAPFWKEVVRSALSRQSLAGLLRAGWGTIKGAWAIPYMQRAYRNGLLQYGVLQATR